MILSPTTQEELDAAIKTSDLIRVTETLLSMIVCAPKTLTPEQVTEHLNHEQLSGTSAGWQLREGEVKGGQPCQCLDSPDRNHWLFDC